MLTFFTYLFYCLICSLAIAVGLDWIMRKVCWEGSISPWRMWVGINSTRGFKGIRDMCMYIITYNVEFAVLCLVYVLYIIEIIVSFYIKLIVFVYSILISWSIISVNHFLFSDFRFGPKLQNLTALVHQIFDAMRLRMIFRIYGVLAQYEPLLDVDYMYLLNPDLGIMPPRRDEADRGG